MTKLLDAEVVLACQPSRPFEYTIGQVAVTEDGRVVFAEGYRSAIPQAACMSSSSDRLSYHKMRNRIASALLLCVVVSAGVYTLLGLLGQGWSQISHLTSWGTPATT